MRILALKIAKIDEKNKIYFAGCISDIWFGTLRSERSTQSTQPAPTSVSQKIVKPQAAYFSAAGCCHHGSIIRLGEPAERHLPK